MEIMKWFLLFVIISWIFHKIIDIFPYVFETFGWVKQWNSEGVRKTLINLIVGLSIMVIIISLQDLPWMIEAEDASMDWMMELNQKIIPPREGIPSFVFLDIDDKTYSSWGEPLFTPRNLLKNIIETVISANPKVIIVNIDISQPTPVIDKLKLHPEDQALKNYLENYANDCKEKENCPLIILTQAFKVQTEGQEGYPEPREGFLEEVVKNGTPYLQLIFTHKSISLEIQRV